MDVSLEQATSDQAPMLANQVRKPAMIAQWVSVLAHPFVMVALLVAAVRFSQCSSSLLLSLCPSRC